MHFRTPALPGLLVLLFLAVGCGSSSTAVTATAPSATRCAISATASPRSFPSAGGSGTITIDAARECSWTVGSDTSWIVPDHTSGQGQSTLAFRVSANATPGSRRGALTITSTRVEVAQDGAPCRFALDTSRVEVAPGGGAGRIGISALSGCDWTARAQSAWITVTGGASGDGDGEVRLSIAANPGAARQGSVAVAGQTVIVAQRAFTEASPSPSPAPEPSPGPAPTPGPAPPSAPEPTPPPGPAPAEAVQLEGRVRSLRGFCPDLTFALDGTTVYTDAGTGYRAGNCKHIKEGSRILVVGQRESNGRVRAERVDIEQKD